MSLAQPIQGVVALLVQPDFRDAKRPAAYVEKLAAKHPTSIISSAGAGLAVYELERAALAAGLLVVAFRTEPWSAPRVAPPRRAEDYDADGEYTGSVLETKWRIVMHELRAEDSVALWRPDPRSVGAALGYHAAQEAALRSAWLIAEQRVVFTATVGWPPINTDSAQVLGL